MREISYFSAWYCSVGIIDLVTIVGTAPKLPSFQSLLSCHAAAGILIWNLPPVHRALETVNHFVLLDVYLISYIWMFSRKVQTLYEWKKEIKKQLSLRVKSPPNNETFMLPDDICSDGCVLVLTEYHFILPTFNLLQNSAILLFPSTILTWNHPGLWKNSPLHYQASQTDTLIPTQISQKCRKMRKQASQSFLFHIYGHFIYEFLLCKLFFRNNYQSRNILHNGNEKLIPYVFESQYCCMGRVVLLFIIKQE